MCDGALCKAAKSFARRVMLHYSRIELNQFVNHFSLLFLLNGIALGLMQTYHLTL